MLAIADAETRALSLRSYAKHRAAIGLRGGSAEAVRKAINTGRLSRSVVEVRGQKQIRSAEEADREWAANTRVERSAELIREAKNERDRKASERAARPRLSPQEAKIRAAEKAKQRRHSDADYKARCVASQIKRKRAIRETQVEPVRRDWVAERDGWRCAICGDEVTRETWSLDHVVPLSKGGPHTYDNVVLAHRICNIKRGAGRFPVKPPVQGWVVKVLPNGDVIAGERSRGIRLGKSSKNQLPSRAMCHHVPGMAISLRKYAEHKGVSHTAVQRAIASGRLRAAVEIVNGRPQIRDVEIADREWHENTRPSSATMGTAVPVAPATEPGVPADVNEVPSFERSRARREAALAGLAELELDERRGKLVLVEVARAGMIDRFTAVRTRLLGLPSRCRQQLPHLTDTDVMMIDDLVREALEELAADDAPPAS